MNWVDTVWPMISAASLTMAVIYGLAWLRTPARVAHLLIGVAAASVAAVGLLELAAMNAESPEVYARMVRWAHVPVAIVVACVVGFVFTAYGVGSAVLAVAAIATRIACLLPNFLSGVNINYESIGSLRLVMFMGTQVSIPDVATPNPWTLLGGFNALIVVAFLVHAIAVLVRRTSSPSRTRAMVTCCAMLGFAVFSSIWTQLVVHGKIGLPHLFAPMFLGVLLTMGYKLADGYSQAGRLSESLELTLERLRAARRRVVQAVDATGVGFWSLDRKSGRVQLSQHACALVGVPAHEALVLDDLAARLLRPDRERFLAAIEACGRGQFQCEFRVASAGGKQRWIAARGNAVQGGNDSLDGVLVDITDRKEAESRFRLVVEAAAGPQVVVAPTGKVAFANQAAAGIFGCGADELVGLDLRTLIRSSVDEADADAEDAGSWLPSVTIGTGVELVGIRRGSCEPVPLAVTFNPIPFEADLFLLVSLVDLSGKRWGEHEQAPQRDEVVHLSRISLLATMSGSLAHELNQPLAAILANAQAARRFLDRQEPDLHEVRESLDAIAASNIRAAEIIKRLRALLRKDNSGFRSFDIGTAIDEVVGMLCSDLTIRKVALRVERPQPLPQVWGDSIQIQQVILNLLMNACDSMEGLPSPRQVVIRADAADGHVRVSVVDHGSGIEVGELERMFLPFHTSKRDGLGIGLAVCRTIVMAHLGEIWAESEGIGKGAVVSFRLPQAVSH